MKILDITIDFETASLRPDAALLQLAAVAWCRFTRLEDNPFYDGDKLPIGLFNNRIDANCCVAEGYHFDGATVYWWSKNSDESKKGILSGEPLSPKNTLVAFLKWIQELKDKTGADTICLWSQGTDCDITWLRGMCERYQMDMPVSHVYFRDARTFVLESIALVQDSVMSDFSHAYDKLAYRFEDWAVVNVPKLIAGIDTHHAIYDCLRTSFNVWLCMTSVRLSLNGDEIVYFTKSKEDC